MLVETHLAVDVLALPASGLASPGLSASLRSLLADGRGTRARRVVVQATEGQAPPGDLGERLSLLAALHPGVTLVAGDGREFHHPTGCSGYLAERLRGQEGRLPAVARFTAGVPCETGGELLAEVALQWLVGGEGSVLSVVNDEITPGHGTPLVGFVAGLSKALEEEGLDRDLLHYGMPALTKRRVLPGVAVVLRLSHPSPLYSTPARSALASRDAQPLFEQLAHRKVRALCHENPGLIEALLTRALGMPVGKQAERRLGSHPELTR